MILATVTTVLMNAASFTPRRIVKWKAQTPTEDSATASTVLPSPRAGNSAPQVDLTSTQ